METQQRTLTTTSQLLIEIDVGDFDNITLMADADWLLFLNGSSGSGFKVLGSSAVELTPQMFAEDSKIRHEKVRIYGRVSAGTTTIYIAAMRL